MKRLRRQSAQTYAASSPYNRLYIARQAIGPLHAFMTRVLAVSGGQWERKQAAQHALGKPRTFLILEAARGGDLCQAMTQLLQIIFDSTSGVHTDTFTCVHRALKLGMVASGVCAMHALLRRPRDAMPYQAFHLAAQDISDDELKQHAERLAKLPPCLHDEFWAGWSKKYPDKTDLLGSECRGLLQCLASVIALDVASIESAHSSTREFANLRSRGWVSSLEEVSSRFVLLQRKRRNKQTYSAANNTIKKSRRHGASDPQKSGQRKKERQASISAWNAFVHVHAAGQRPSAELHSRLSQMFRDLSDDEKQIYIDAGQAASAARKMGFPAFATSVDKKQRKSKKLPWNQGMLAGPSSAVPMLLAGDETAAGAIVAQDAEPLDDALIADVGGQVTEHLRKCFPDMYTEFVQQLSKWKDPLELDEAEQVQLEAFCQQFDVPEVPVAKQWQDSGNSQLRKNLEAYPISNLVRCATWNPPAEKAVEAKIWGFRFRACTFKCRV